VTVSGAKRLKVLEDENARLKKLLAEQMLDAAAVKELLAKMAADTKCAFRGTWPPIPTASGHPYRGIRPPLTRCIKACGFLVN